MAPKSVSNLKLAISSWLTPISLRQSSKSPTQSLKVPIFATLPGIVSKPLTTKGTKDHEGIPWWAVLCSTSCPWWFALSLFRLEYGRPFLHVRSQAFSGVFALEQELLILALHRQGGLHRNLPPRLHCALDPPHRFCCLVGGAELAGVFHDVLHEIIALVNVVDDPQLFCFFERECVARYHQFDRLALAHDARQSLRSTSAGQYAQIHFRKSDLARILARDADVSSHGNFQAAADAVTV